MENFADEYMRYLKDERRMSSNTVEAYRHDVREFTEYLEQEQIPDVRDIQQQTILSFVEKLGAEGRSQSTMGRKISSVRSYITWLYEKGRISSNPSVGVKPRYGARKDVDYLTLEEVDRLLAVPEDTRKGIRDRAILELLYGTGIRVTELISMLTSEMNLTIGYVTCRGDYGKARIIPLGGPCRAALKRYMEESRPYFLETSRRITPSGTDTEYLFLNVHGEKLTRQGLWKIVSNYSQMAGLEHKLTPQVLRNSFAVHMLQNGADVRSVQEMLGHSDISTTQIYLNMNDLKMREVYMKAHPRS